MASASLTQSGSIRLPAASLGHLVFKGLEECSPISWNSLARCEVTAPNPLAMFSPSRLVGWPVSLSSLAFGTPLSSNLCTGSGGPAVLAKATLAVNPTANTADTRRTLMMRFNISNSLPFSHQRGSDCCLRPPTWQRLSTLLLNGLVPRNDQGRGCRY